MDVTPYLDMIRAWNPNLDLSNIRVDPYGLNNLVLIVDEEWVCRFPRHPDAWDRLRREAALLALIARHVRVAVPVFTVDPHKGFVAYQLLPGRPAYRHDLMRLTEVEQDQFAADMAGFLGDLHRIPPADLAAAGIAQHPPIDRDTTINNWGRRLEDLRAEIYPHLWADQQAYIEDLFAPVLDGRLNMAGFKATLIHNDLASYHLLIHPDTRRLSGVLDFGEAGWGDPAIDLGTLISAFGETFLRRVAQTYPVSNDLLERSRFRAAYLELEWTLKGVRTNDPEWYLVHLGRARDSRPFGVG
jgi:aminoglycoside 2''-phosphotransferase